MSGEIHEYERLNGVFFESYPASHADYENHEQDSSHKYLEKQSDEFRALLRSTTFRHSRLARQQEQVSTFIDTTDRKVPYHGAYIYLEAQTVLVQNIKHNSKKYELLNTKDTILRGIYMGIMSVEQDRLFGEQKAIRRDTDMVMPSAGLCFALLSDRAAENSEDGFIIPENSTVIVPISEQDIEIVFPHM